MRKIGGLWFWRIGRIGGSVYIKAAAPASPQDRALRYLAWSAFLLNFGMAVALAGSVR